MRRSRALLLLGLAAVLPAQAPQEPAAVPQSQYGPKPDLRRLPAPTASFASRAGLHVLDGTLCAGSDTFKASFRQQGIEFTPALPLAPHNYPVTLRTVAFGRGAAAMPVTEVEPAQRDMTVVYARPEFVETYDVRPEGLKQSFTFTSLPAGQGDLVVACELRTELQPRWLDDALELALPGIGSVVIRDVVGVDAAGTRTVGSLAYENGRLEVRLPADAVANAKLPLVLDPLIGSLTVHSTDDVTDPDVAFDASNGLYLVTFDRAYSVSDHDVHGQLVTTSGTLQGGRLFIENSGAYEWHGRVANVTSENCFAVVYTRNSSDNDIYCRAVNANDSSISAATIVAATANSLYYPDVGGEATSNDNDAICVYMDLSADELRAVQLSVVTGSPPSVVPFGDTLISGTQSTSWSESQPQISKSGGPTGRYLVTWGRFFTAFAGNEGRGVVFDRNITILNSLVAITNDQSSIDNDLLANDGDGTTWVVAWERELSPASGDNDIYAVTVVLSPTNQVTIEAGPIAIASTANDQQFQASVSWLGGSALIGWTDTYSTTTGDDDLLLRNVDPSNCLACEGTLGVNFSFDDDDTLVFASAYSGGAFTSNGALAAHRQRDISPAPGTNTSDILAQVFDAEDGDVTDYGGGCGAGGTLTVTCARVGNGNFGLTLRGAGSSLATVVMFSSVYMGRACGGCTLIPDVWQGTFGFGPTTDGQGNARYLIAIPADPAISGFGIYAQLAVAGTNCFSGFDLSNGVFARID